MCGTCGCGQPETSNSRVIQIEQDIMADNKHHATRNRAYFAKHHIFTMNLVSSPGSGKTTLLEYSLPLLMKQFPVAVIEGDQHTEHDAQRIAKAGAKVTQINTGKVCHLDAHGIGHAVLDLDVADNSVLFIENVGNLVCPALFDLGENKRVVLVSVTEGDDKPIKYADMFVGADLLLINKMDLLPYVNFSVERCIDYAKQVNPTIETLCITANQADGLTPWLDWLRQQYCAIDETLTA